MKPAQKIFVGFLLILVFLLYLFRLQSVSRLNIPEGREIRLKGRVSQQPYLKDSYQIIYVGPIFLKTDRFPGYFYGDRLVVTGRFERRVINPFNTRYSAYFPDIKKVEENGKGDFLFIFKCALYNFRGRLEKVIEAVLPEPQASLLIGILLGVMFYTLMVGAEPPVVRAAIMAGLAYTAKYLGRMSDGLITLIITAIIMLFLSPLILFDIGFQLSLMATTGILLIQPLLKEIS